MKPDFALSLSFEGIGLLVREGAGWRLLGDVALDADDLAGALADLRGGVGASTDAIRCKIVLPNDQLRYATLDTGRVRDKARRAQAQPCGAGSFTLLHPFGCA